MIKINYDDLPVNFAKQIPRNVYLRACHSPFKRSIVCWIKRDNQRWQKEIEFDMDTNKEIEDCNRLVGLPVDEKYVLEDGKMIAIRNFSIHQPSSCLTEEFAIYLTDDSTKIADAKQFFFMSIKENHVELCNDAISRAQLFKAYPSWPTAEKINYWVAHLYRLRRHTAEAGGEESNVFSRGLLDQMAETDPNIVGLFPGVVRALALMEGENEAELLELAGKKAGLVLQ